VQRNFILARLAQQRPAFVIWPSQAHFAVMNLSGLSQAVLQMRYFLETMAALEHALLPRAMQAGALPVSQPSAPTEQSQPVIGYQ
jgi:hypothetical protein